MEKDKIQDETIGKEAAAANATSISDQMDPQTKARSFVYQWAKVNAPDTDFALSDVKVVWFSKILQNWKAIITIIGTKDNFLFEVTYSGDKKDTNLDAYTKLDQVRIPDA